MNEGTWKLFPIHWPREHNLGKRAIEMESEGSRISTATMPPNWASLSLSFQIYYSCLSTELIQHIWKYFNTWSEGIVVMPVRNPASEDNEIQEGKSKLIGLSTPTRQPEILCPLGQLSLSPHCSFISLASLAKLGIPELMPDFPLASFGPFNSTNIHTVPLCGALFSSWWKSVMEPSLSSVFGPSSPVS